jgi:hypothetical protein
MLTTLPYLQRTLIALNLPAVLPPATAQQVNKSTLRPETNLNSASFSEVFTHVSYVGTHRMRQVVYRDGQVGAAFDKVVSSSPILSGDGLHCAYSVQTQPSSTTNLEASLSENLATSHGGNDDPE